MIRYLRVIERTSRTIPSSQYGVPGTGKRDHWLVQHCALVHNELRKPDQELQSVLRVQGANAVRRLRAARLTVPAISWSVDANY